MKLSRPDKFNDPWDCRLHYEVSTDPAGRDKVIEYWRELHRIHYPHMSETTRALIAYDFKSDPSKISPLLKNEWVEMGDPAPSRRRTHGGTGAGALALVKPLPPKAVAGRPGFTRTSAPGHNRHRRTDGLRFTTISRAPSVSAGTTSPIRNSKEPDV